MPIFGLKSQISPLSGKIFQKMQLSLDPQYFCAHFGIVSFQQNIPKFRRCLGNFGIFCFKLSISKCTQKYFGLSDNCIFWNILPERGEICDFGPKYGYLGQNTRYFDFPVEISVKSEISICRKLLFRECGYFGNFGFFIRPLEKKVHIQERPIDFESILGHNIVWI